MNHIQVKLSFHEPFVETCSIKIRTSLSKPISIVGKKQQSVHSGS